MLNSEPRLNKRTVAGGIPHRMVATHEALYDIFPGTWLPQSLLSGIHPRFKHTPSLPLSSPQLSPGHQHQ
jgi:hypothetical protein